MRRSGGLLAVAVVVAALIVTAVVALTRLDDGSEDSGTAAVPAAPVTSTSSAPSSSAAPAPSSSPVAQTSPAARAPITYTVKRGDNLTVIAAWFKLRGYGDLYERNKRVIGADPDLIRPGQRITISPAGVTTSR